MVNKICPICGHEIWTKWYITRMKPYTWILQCQRCGIVLDRRNNDD